MFDIKNKDFTYYKYEELIKAIIDSNYKVYTIFDWYKNKPKQGIVIRHDIDRWAKNALNIAKLENYYGIKTTYYFRKTKSSFKPEIIKEIAEMGHEIGYHYEDLSLANGDFEKAKELFKLHLENLRIIEEVKTCAMHGRPFSKFDNRDLWNKYNLQDFGLLAEAFLTVDYTETYYFTDTGRSWADNSANLRDKVKTNKKANIETTDELINFIKKNNIEKIAIVMHPERWGKDEIKYLKSKSIDGIINIIKNLIRKNK